MSAQTNLATAMCSQYEWGMILVRQYGSLFIRNMIGKIVPVLRPQIARVIFPIAIGVKMAVYLKGVQMATTRSNAMANRIPDSATKATWMKNI